ncbi:UNVERIFIED_CONTAM: hypothetical protein DES50_102768 [Williamsia faeni]
MWFRRRTELERDAEDAGALREQAEKVMQDAEQTRKEAERLARKAAGIERAVRAEMRRNSWTDTLFGVIETGRQ